MGIATGVAGIVGVLVVGASVDRVVDTPSRYGTHYDFEARKEFGPPSATEELGRDLATDPEVAAVTLALAGEVLVGDDHRAQAWGTESLKGEQLFTLLDGRFPAAPDEVAVGIATRSTVGQPGADRIQLGAPGGTKSFRVVGHALFPPSQTEAFADGVLLTRSGIEQLGAAQGATLLGSWAARTDRVVAVARRRGRRRRRAAPPSPNRQP